MLFILSMLPVQLYDHTLEGVVYLFLEVVLLILIKVLDVIL